MLKILHTADLHFSPKTEKLDETIRVSDFMLAEAERRRPDVAIIAGDLADEYDGAIRVDSPCARAMIAFIVRLAEICPVLVVRGTRSHDRDVPWVLSHLQTKHEVAVVSDQPGYITLHILNGALRWGGAAGADNVVATFGCFPSPDKAWMAAVGAQTIQEVNNLHREAIEGVFRSFNAITRPDKPHIVVAHGMVRGSRLSSGVTMLDDVEFSLGDFADAGADYVALGHVHAYQTAILSNGAPAVYSGSPGRNDFGETETKGFVMVEFTGKMPAVEFVPTPAREFCFIEREWAEGDTVEMIESHAGNQSGLSRGTYARYRYAIPEECAVPALRQTIEQIFLNAGAIACKVEAQIIPTQRPRIEGICRLRTVTDKFSAWATTQEGIDGGCEGLVALLESGTPIDEIIANTITSCRN